MSNMTEEMGRIAAGIAASRQQRAQAARARPVVVRERRRDVAAMLRAMAEARERIGRDQRRHAAAAQRHRRDEVKTLLEHCHRARVTQHRKRVETAAAQKAEAAAFMRELTRAVADMRDGFGASQAARARACRDLTQEVRRQLADYGRDRHGGRLAWSRGAKQPHPHAAVMSPRRGEPASISAPAAEAAARPARHRAGHGSSSEGESAP